MAAAAAVGITVAGEVADVRVSPAMTAPTEPAQSLTTSPTAVLDRREPEALTLQEHEEILGRLRRISMLTGAVAGVVGGVVAGVAPTAASIALVGALFVAGRLMRRARRLPFQVVLAEYGIDAAGEERLQAAWKAARRQPGRERGVAGLARATWVALHGAPPPPDPT